MDLFGYFFLWNLLCLDRNFRENLPSTLQVVEVVSSIFTNFRVFSWTYFTHMSQYLLGFCLIDIFYLFKQRLLQGKILKLFFVNLNQLLMLLKFFKLFCPVIHVLLIFISFFVQHPILILKFITCVILYEFYLLFWLFFDIIQRFSFLFLSFLLKTKYCRCLFKLLWNFLSCAINSRWK